MNTPKLSLNWLVVAVAAGAGALAAVFAARPAAPGAAVAAAPGALAPAAAVPAVAAPLAPPAAPANAAVPAALDLSASAASSPALPAAAQRAPAPGAAPSAPRPEGERMLIATETDLTAHEKTAAHLAVPSKDEERKSASARSMAQASASSPAALKDQKKGDRGDLAAVATVRYGVADRSELMGRGAGPVYNLGVQGADNPAEATVGASMKQMATLVEGVTKNAAGNPRLDPRAKKVLDEQMRAINAATSAATAGNPGQ